MNINLHTPVGGTGYGIAGLNLIKSLNEFGHSISCHLIGRSFTCNNQDEVELIQKCIGNAQNYDYDAPSIKIWHQFALAEHIGKGLNIGFPIFELDTFTEQEKHHILSTDKLYVCSNWAKQIVEKEMGHKDVCVIPLGVDNSIFYPSSNPKTDNTYRFFNCGKIEIRKGHDILVDIFNKAFTKDDDVELWMMFYNPFFTKEENQEWIDYYKNSPMGDKIKIIPPVKIHNEVANIMRQVDCGILPSKGEGFGLENLELLACGKPIITTNYSGHTEYCTPENSYLIEIDELELAYDGKWFNKQGNWAKIDQKQIDQAVEYMRFCYKNRPANPEGLKTAEKFTWTNSAQKIIDNLTNI